MDLTEQQKKGQEVLFKIISEAWENDYFKQALLANPEKTLEQLFGRKFATNKPIKVTDQSDPSYLYINIPIKPQDEDQQIANQPEVDTSDTGSDSFTMTDYKSLYDSLDDTTR